MIKSTIKIQIGDVLTQCWHQNQIFIVVQTKTYKAGWGIATFELYCPQTNSFYYPQEKVVYKEYEKVF